MVLYIGIHTHSEGVVNKTPAADRKHTDNSQTQSALTVTLVYYSNNKRSRTGLKTKSHDVQFPLVRLSPGWRMQPPADPFRSTAEQQVCHEGGRQIWWLLSLSVHFRQVPSVRVKKPFNPVILCATSRSDGTAVSRKTGNNTSKKKKCVLKLGEGNSIAFPLEISVCFVQQWNIPSHFKSQLITVTHSGSRQTHKISFVVAFFLLSPGVGDCWLWGGLQ